GCANGVRGPGSIAIRVFRPDEVDGLQRRRGRLREGGGGSDCNLYQGSRESNRVSGLVRLVDHIYNFANRVGTPRSRAQVVDYPSRKEIRGDRELDKPVNGN